MVSQSFPGPGETCFYCSVVARVSGNLRDSSFKIFLLFNKGIQTPFNESNCHEKRGIVTSLTVRAETVIAFSMRLCKTLPLMISMYLLRLKEQKV